LTVEGCSPVPQYGELCYCLPAMLND
jgi:hypothetical protein